MGYTLDQSMTAAPENYQAVADHATYQYVSQEFTPSVTDDVGKVTLYLYRQGTPTRDYTVGIYTNVAGVPTTLLSSLETFASSDVTTNWSTATAIDIVFATPASVTAETLYHIKFGSASTDATNHLLMSLKGTSGYSRGTFRYLNAGAWTELGAGMDTKFYEYRGTEAAASTGNMFMLF